MTERDDRRRHTRCSFCGKGQEQVRKLVAGPGVYICDQCIDLCQEVLEEDNSSTHSSQMNTVGPAMSLRTSCWLLPQNEQYSVFLESLVPTLLIPFSVRRSASLDRSISAVPSWD